MNIKLWNQTGSNTLVLKIEDYKTNGDMSKMKKPRQNLEDEM